MQIKLLHFSIQPQPCSRGSQFVYAIPKTTMLETQKVRVVSSVLAVHFLVSERPSYWRMQLCAYDDVGHWIRVAMCASTIQATRYRLALLAKKGIYCERRARGRDPHHFTSLGYTQPV